MGGLAGSAPPALLDSQSRMLLLQYSPHYSYATLG